MEDYKITVKLGKMPTLGDDVLDLNSRVVQARGNACTFDRVNLNPKLSYEHKIVDETTTSPVDTESPISKTDTWQTAANQSEVIEPSEDIGPDTDEEETYCQEITLFVYIIFLILLLLLSVCIKCWDKNTDYIQVGAEPEGNESAGEEVRIVVHSDGEATETRKSYGQILLENNLLLGLCYYNESLGRFMRCSMLGMNYLLEFCLVSFGVV